MEQKQEAGSSNGEVVVIGPEGSVYQSNESVASVDSSSAVTESNLSPYAAEWDPFYYQAPEDDRCCFITFSNGFPLTEDQIMDFFNERFGSCVERVYVHCPHPWENPLFGKVVFNSVLIPAIVLRGQVQVKFKIDRRPLWCKRFDRGRHRNPALIN
ncbi:uncharacterized protein Pyn_36143 [Prunus yedoensis var. nudiflora]|uniref:RRM domain-containing protein n=1 Tax=Prunus yedoensis var. nudiflora TaxID=2094558 RepID=A0A314YCA1_PRUYE|nr:uncharacterized protein Pyn_36143 [Prunus yedoensis var. nudiflora]